MTGANVGESLKSAEVETFKAVLTLSDDVRSELHEKLQLELELIDRMRKFVEAADALAGINNDIIGDIFEVSEKAQQVAGSLPTDNILILESDSIQSIKGEFGSHDKLLAADYGGFFAAKAIDTDTGRIVVDGWAEKDPENPHESPLSKFAFIMNPNLRIQDVEVYIVRDAIAVPKIEPILAALTESLRRASEAEQPPSASDLPGSS
jgi:hypothetical protein